MPLTRPEIDRALSTITHKAIARKNWKAVEAVAHVEAALFGYDPGCNPGCPYCS